MFKLYSSVLYNGVLNFTQDSSFLMRSFRQLVTDLNKPIVFMFWGILVLVVLDVFHQLMGDSTKYGYLVGKVMIEAFFYSLFFAIWSDVFQRKNWKTNVKLMNGARQVFNIKKYFAQPKVVIGVYFIMNNALVIYYASINVCILYCIFSAIIYFRISSLIMPYALNDSHVYVQTNGIQNLNNQQVDAIIKWEYSNVPKSSSNNNNWIILG